MPTPAENILTIRDNYIAALLADSANPQPSYSWEGVSVSRTEWRQQQLLNVTECNKVAETLNPQEYRTQFM